MKTITTIMLWLATAIASGQTFHAPESVKNGEAIKFSVDEAEEGDQILWRVLHPRGTVQVKKINTRSGLEFVVDPPIGYAGAVEVLCTVVNLDAKKFHQDELIVMVEAGDVIDPPKPPDDDKDDDKEDDEKPDDPEPSQYDGPNKFGVGQVSFDSIQGYDAEMAEVFRKAGDYLYGIPNLKVIATQDASKSGTDFLVFNWISGQVQGTERKRWLNAVYKKMESVSKSKTLSLADWYEIFIEVKSGIEARK